MCYKITLVSTASNKSLYFFLCSPSKRSTQASFSVRLANDHTYADQENIAFDEVLVNDGGHYDPDTGLFVCPVNGMYFVTWTMQVVNGER